MTTSETSPPHTEEPIVEPAPAPPINEVRRRTNGKKGSGSPLKSILVLGLVAVLMVVFAAAAWVRNKRSQPVASRVETPAVSVVRNDGVTADETLSPRYKELEKQANADEIQAAQSEGIGAVVVPAITGDPVAQEDPQIDIQPYTPPPRADDDARSQRTSRGDDAAMRSAKMREALDAMRTVWRQPSASATTAGVPDGSTLSFRSGAGMGATAAASAVPAPTAPLFVAMPAVIEVGANSDFPAEVVARITRGALTGARAVGRLETAGRNGVADRVQLRFDQIEYQGAVYRTEALGIDPATRIPALKGNINRHVVRNVLAQAGATFLIGYAAGLTEFGGLSFDTASGTIIQRYSVGDVMRAEAAGQTANTLQTLGSRLPTITLPVGAPVSLVLLEPLTSPQSAQIPFEAVGNSSPAQATSAAAAAPRPRLPARSVLPDGTSLEIAPLESSP